MNAFKFNPKIHASIRYTFIAFLVLIPIILQAQPLSYFKVSDDIGNPEKRWVGGDDDDDDDDGWHWEYKQGEVLVGKPISSVFITARDENGDRLNNYNGSVYLSQVTNYGMGRISPESVNLVNGQWQGTIKVYRVIRLLSRL